MGKIIRKINDPHDLIIFVMVTLAHILLLVYSPKLYFYVILIPLAFVIVIWILFHMYRL
jgi:hypothetical protein